MKQWMVQIELPGHGDPLVAERLSRALRREIVSQKRVGREFYHHLRRRHQGAFVSADGAEAIAMTATAALAMARALDNCDLPVPEEFTLVLTHREEP